MSDGTACVQRAVATDTGRTRPRWRRVVGWLVGLGLGARPRSRLALRPDDDPPRPSINHIVGVGRESAPGRERRRRGGEGRSGKNKKQHKTLQVAPLVRSGARFGRQRARFVATIRLTEARRTEADAVVVASTLT